MYFELSRERHLCLEQSNAYHLYEKQHKRKLVKLSQKTKST